VGKVLGSIPSKSIVLPYLRVQYIFYAYIYPRCWGKTTFCSCLLPTYLRAKLALMAVHTVAHRFHWRDDKGIYCWYAVSGCGWLLFCSIY